jgi:bifunctional UDP-N-acetylglucosamine pyrophosphorylase/glucosamine-1-phosphate N-acetyltransferase
MNGGKMRSEDVISVVMAAGRGSRMNAFDGNKTLLPLVPEKGLFEGREPILVHVLRSLPQGEKAVIVHHRAEEVMAATRAFAPTYCRQPELNGTGGALLAVREFLASRTCERLLITMGDVPFVRPETYAKLVARLDTHHMAALGFQPADKKQYGVLETEGDRVLKITEWKYWRDYPAERQAALGICNAGIYAARREVLVRYLSVLESRPQSVQKARDGKMTTIREYFLTDIVEYMNADGLSVGCVLADDEMETMGVDDPAALEKAQDYYRRHFRDAAPGPRP